MARLWHFLLFFVLLFTGAEANAADCSGKLLPVADVIPQVGQFYIKPPGGRVYLPSANCVLITSAQRNRFKTIDFYINNKIQGAPPIAYIAYQYVRRFSGPIQDSKFKVGRNDGWYLPEESGQRISVPKLRDTAIEGDLTHWNDFFKVARSPVEFNELLGDKWVAYLNGTEDDNSAEKFEFWRMPNDLDLSDGVVTNGANRFLTRSSGPRGFINILSINVMATVRSITLKVDSNVSNLQEQSFEFRFE